MKPFKFRLDALLEFRKMQKQQVETIFLKATNQLRIEKESLVNLESKLQENVILLRAEQQQGVSIEKLKFFGYYFEKINKDIAEQIASVAQVEAYCQKCLQDLTEAQKNYKIVEKFREKKLHDYQIEALDAEQKLLDEIGLQIYIRGK